MKYGLLCACVASMLVLAGCVSTPAPTGDLTGAKTWMLTGKLGVRSREENANLGIRWEQEGDAFRINLSGPLGLSVASIHGDADGVTLETSRGKTLTARDPDELVNVALGYRIPVRPMRYWVRGMAAPGAPWRGTDDGINQLGWRIAWREWRDGRPTRMTFRLPGATLRLVVRSWDY